MKNHQVSTTIRLFSFLAIITIFALSCSKDSPTPPPPVTDKFMATFTQNFINPQLDAIIFISDMQGAVLADTMISGNGVIQLPTKTGEAYPSNFMVTIATWEPYVHNFLVNLKTYYYVNSKSWLFEGHRAEKVGSASVTLNNVPAQHGPVIFSNSGFSNVTFNTANRVCDLYVSPDNMYIHMNTQEGSFYNWLEGVTDNGVYSVDFATAQPNQNQTVTFPQSVAYYDGKVLGYRDYDTQSPLFFLVDELISGAEATTSFSIAYPPLLFANYHTEVSFLTDWTSPSTYFYWVDGVLPTEIKMINAGVSTINPSVGKVDFTTTGSYNVSNAIWTFSATNNQIFEWSVFAPDSVKDLFIPEFPTSLTHEFPVLKVDSLSLKGVQLMNFYWLSTYKDVLYQMYETNPTTQMNHLEAGTVLVTP